MICSSASEPQKCAHEKPCVKSIQSHRAGQQGSKDDLNPRRFQINGLYTSLLKFHQSVPKRSLCPLDLFVPFIFEVKANLKVLCHKCGEKGSSSTGRTRKRACGLWEQFEFDLLDLLSNVLRRVVKSPSQETTDLTKLRQICTEITQQQFS